MNQNSFNPKARWDRFQPQNTGFDPGALNEKIEVLAYFKQARIFPQSFFWHSKEYKIDNITYTWQERLGQALISYFSVACAGQLYQISFNNTSLRWQIDKII